MNTVKISIIFMLLSLGVGQLNGQDNQYNHLPYRPWPSFKGDTLAYLVYNYGNMQAGNDMRKKLWQGLKVSDLFDELELPVTYVVGTVFQIGSSPEKSGTISIRLGIRQTGVLPSSTIDCYIEITFAEPLPSEITAKLDFESDVSWAPQMYEVIKNLKLEKVFFNPYYPPKGREDIIIKSKEWQRKNYERVKKEKKEAREIRRKRAEKERSM